MLCIRKGEGVSEAVEGRFGVRRRGTYEHLAWRWLMWGVEGCGGGDGLRDV